MYDERCVCVCVSMFGFNSPQCRLPALTASIAGTIKLRKQLSSNGMQLTNTLAEKLCSEMSDYCPKPTANDEGSSKEEEL